MAVRVLLAVLLPALALLLSFPTGPAPSLGVMGLALATILAGSMESSALAARAWMVAIVALAIGVPLYAGVRDPVALGVSCAAVPAVLLLLFRHTQQLARARELALTTSEIARAKLARSNQELSASVSRSQEALAKLDTIVHDLADGLVAVSEEGLVEIANPRLVELLDLPEDPTGSDSQQLPAAIRELVQACLESQETVVQEVAIRNDGVGKATAAPVHREGGVWGAVLILRDITVDKELDRMKSDFVATVSHELRTPLTSVLGFAKLIGNQLERKVFPVVPEDERAAQRALGTVRKNLQVIGVEGERLTDLIGDVIDLARLRADQIELDRAPHAPHELIARAVQQVQPLFTPLERVDLKHQVDELAPIEVDGDRIVQVLANLLGNAAKFTEQGQVEVHAEVDESGTRFVVRDTGIGIAPADQERVFETFQQVGDVLTDRPQGTGLGLAICLEIVQAHGGDMGLESTPGQGSRFWFRVPPVA